MEKTATIPDDVPLLKLIQVVDRSRTHHSSKITENLPLTLTDIDVLLKLVEFPYGLDEKRLQQYTGLALSTVSKSMSKLLLHNVCYLKSSRPTKVFSVRPARKAEVKNLGGLYRIGKIQDTFDSHAFTYSLTLSPTDIPFKLQKKAAKYGKHHGWIEAARHPQYRQWEFQVPFGSIHFRIGNRGTMTLSIILETLAFHPLQIGIINRYKLSLILEHLKAKYDLDILKLNLDIVFEYAEVPWLLDPLAVNAIKCGVLDRYKDLEQSWLPESEQKGTDAIDKMELTYGLRQFCIKNNITEADLAAFFKERPELLKELAERGGTNAT